MNKLFTFSADFHKISPFRLIFIFILSILFFSAHGQGTISGYVWEDTNGNGIKDAPESYKPGYQVELRIDGSANLVSSATTAADGSYSFNAIPAGTYYVQFLIAPYTATPDGIGPEATDCDVTEANGTYTTDDITITAAEILTNIDAGYYIAATISDKVWHDQNANGVQDVGEPGIDGITVTLTGNPGVGAPINQSVTTSGGGNYEFTNIPPGLLYAVSFNKGTYQITYQDQGGDEATDSDPDPTTGIFSIGTIVSGDDFTGIVDCGLYIYATVGNFVWHDLNGNGIQDGGEAGIAGIIVTLNGTTGNGTGVNPSTITDGAGNYLFNSVIPGTYTINFNKGATYQITYQDEGGDDATDSDPDPLTGDFAIGILVSDDDDTNIDCGMYVYGTIGNFVWEDLNGNGLQDVGEPGRGGVDVTLNGTTGNGTVVNETKTTDGTGNYIFDQVIPGNYSLFFDEPVPLKRTFANQGGDDNIDSDADELSGNTINFNIISDQDDNKWDAGYYRYAEINGFTWHDINGDAFFTEPPIGGVTVTLTGTNGIGGAVNLSEITDAAGYYEFDEVVPGTGYMIHFGNAVGYDGFTTPVVGGDSYPDPANGNTNVFAVVSNDLFEDIDAGYINYIVVGDFVWEDRNGNGLQDVGESGVEGVTVNLVRSSDNAILATTTTDVAGFYEFDATDEVGPGQFFVAFIPQAIYGFTYQNSGSGTNDSDPNEGTGWTNNFIMDSGDDRNDIDAGLFKPILIGDQCWRDQNTNGAQDVGEFAMPNVEVWLYRTSDNAQMDYEVTDVNGLYFFGADEALKPGEFYVTFGIPASFSITIKGAAAGNIDSDADPVSGVTDNFTLLSGNANTDIDCGFYVEPPEDCDGEPAPECVEAEILCELQQLNEFCTPMEPQWQQVPIPGCGSGFAFHNPSWFAFVAGDDNISLIIHASPCNPGGGGGSVGIQWGIYDDCDLQGPVTLQCPCVQPGDISVNLTGLTAGKTYYFFIDGCNGTMCTYWIEISSGGGIPTVLGPNDVTCDSNFPNCQNICAGADVTFTLEDVYNASHYRWNINGTIIDTDDPFLTTQFATPGSYYICVYGFNDCNEGDPFCFTIEVIQLPPEDLGSPNVCTNDLQNGYTPPGWLGGPLTTSGAHTNTSSNAQGCIYDQIVEIIELPIEEQTIDTIGCPDTPMIIAGESFFSDGNYEITIPNGGSNGCNKKLKVNLQFLNLFGYLDVACSGNPIRPVRIYFVPGLFSGADNVSVVWMLDGNPIADDDINNIYDINVSQNGTYSIEITLTKNGIDCVFDDYTPLDDIDVESFLPSAPIAVEWEQSVCSNASTYIDYVLTGTNSEYTYEWTYPADVFSATKSADGTVLTINWFGSLGGDVCVYAVDPECGHSDTICYPVQVFPAPNAVFSLIDTICMSESNLITYTGIATSAANFIWNFSGGNETSGTGGTGIGPHNISWNSQGTKIVSLQVEENGCISDFLQKTVEVVSPPSTPNIRCNSTATSITFDWDAVNGSTGTVVIPISGDPGTQNGNTYSITGLDPNETVTISLLIQTNGICPPITIDSITCKAQDCPPITVTSPKDTSICFNGSNATFILDNEINPAGSGKITWVGTGIVDPTTGMFDPKIAGIGDHNVTLKYEFAECEYTDQTIIHIYEIPTSNFVISTDTICIKDAALITYSGNAPTGTPTWDFDGGNIISGTNLAQHTVKWDISGIKNIKLTVENNGCVSNPISVPILVQDTLDDILIKCSPSVNNVNFTWNLDSLAKSYIVFINGTEVNNSLLNSWSVNGLNPGDKVDITVIASADGACGPKTSSFSCEARECPTYTINITPNVSEVCLDANTLPIQFVANVTASDGSTGGTKKWSGPGINQTTGLFDPKVAGPGTHTIKFDYEGICDESANFKITVIERPESQFTVENNVICIKDSIVIDYSNSNPTGTVYNWQLDGGQRKNINASKFSLKWTAPGTYNLSLLTDNKACVSNETKVSVTVEPQLKLPVISCVNATTNSVEIQWNDIDCASNYKVTANGIEVANNANLSYKVQNLNSNSNVNFTVEAISDCACGNVKVSKSCKTEPCPNVAISIQNLPEHLCAAFANTVKLDAIITGPQNGVKNWSGTGIGTDGTINLKNVGTGNFVFKLDYILDNCSYSSKDSILITPEPVFTLTKQDPLCHDEQNGEIYAPSQAGVTYSLAGNIAPDGRFTGLKSGNYFVLAKDTYGCETIESIDLANPPQLNPGITGDVNIKENQKNKFELINVSNVEISNIIWSLINDGVLCQGADCTSIDLGIENDDTLCVEIFDKNDCSASTCLAVTFLENIDIDIPNIFSPDGDGKNDVFFVKADRSVEAIKEMRIYDRWGEMVFFTENVPVNDQSYGWNGQFHGKRLNPGVYVYYIVFKLKERPEMKMAGDVTIMK